MPFDVGGTGAAELGHLVEDQAHRRPGPVARVFSQPIAGFGEAERGADDQRARMVAQVCLGKVGAVAARDVSLALRPQPPRQAATGPRCAVSWSTRTTALGRVACLLRSRI